MNNMMPTLLQAIIISAVFYVALVIYPYYLFRIIFDAYFRAKHAYNTIMMSQLQQELTKEGEQDATTRK